MTRPLALILLGLSLAVAGCDSPHCPRPLAVSDNVNVALGFAPQTNCEDGIDASEGRYQSGKEQRPALFWFEHVPKPIVIFLEQTSPPIQMPTKPWGIVLHPVGKLSKWIGKFMLGPCLLTLALGSFIWGSAVLCMRGRFLAGLVWFFVGFILLHGGLFLMALS